MTNKIGFAIVGCGYWGINYVRLLSQMPDIKLVAIIDQSEERLKEVAKRFPGPKLYTNINDLTEIDEIDAVIICTNPSAHFDVARHFLELGKHLLIEKPMTTQASDGHLLTSLAKEKKVILMVGHIFLYNQGIRKVKSLIDQADIGQIYYLYARRTNLGPFRQDVNALWDLAPHDIYIFNYFLKTKPEWVSAVGASFLRECCEDAGFIVLGYPKGILGHIHVSWADPHKEREIIVVGSNQRIAFNDLSTTEKVRIFEKGVTYSPKESSSFGEHQLLTRDGDIHIPNIIAGEPLKDQVLHFINCINDGTEPLSNGKSGTEVVEVMEAVDISLKNHGAPVNIP